MLLSYLYRAGRGVAVAAALVALADTSVGAQTLKNNSPVAALQKWVAQIDAHDPGEMDAPVIADAGLKPIDRGLLVGIAAPFVAYLRVFDGTNEIPKVRLSPLEKALVKELAARVTGKRTFSEWLHRAVMFETDVAILAPEVTADAMRDAKGTGLAEAVHADDGELGARNLLNWHFQLARELVDQRATAVSDVFAASWYHTVALYQLDLMLLGEMAPHLQRADQLFPSDARIQFDLACLSDAMGSARVQAVMVGGYSGNSTAFRPNVPGETNAERRASAQFAQTLQLDSSFAEPRVRLARLMEKNGKPQDALSLLADASRLTMSPELEYISHLIAARASGAVGKFAEGRAHVKAALALFPSAQAPLVALTQLSLESGDMEGAVSAASQLRLNPERDERNDPWWIYFQATWLNNRKLLDDLRDQVRR